MKILLSEAHKWVDASLSKTYDDDAKGILSTDKDP